MRYALLTAALAATALPAQQPAAVVSVPGSEICALLAAAAPLLGQTNDKPRTRGGGWTTIDVEQTAERVSGAWGSCTPPPGTAYPQLEEVLVSADGKAAIVSGGAVLNGECQFEKRGTAWRKIACFLTFED